LTNTCRAPHNDTVTIPKKWDKINNTYHCCLDDCINGRTVQNRNEKQPCTIIEQWFVLRTSAMLLAFSRLLLRQTTIALTLWFFLTEINSSRETTVAERHTTELRILLTLHLTTERGGGPCSVKLVCILDVTTKWSTISVRLRFLPLGSWLKVGKSLDGPRFVLN
jgi:hypothetical protein